MRSLLAVQSQDYPGASWAIGQRTAGARAVDVDRLYDAGAIIRTHVLRPTWHFVAPEDLRWLLALTAPRVHQASGYQYRSLGIDAPLMARVIDVFQRRLEGGRSATRPELAAAVREARIDAVGLRMGYLTGYAELEGVLCSGPRKGRQHTYALVDERVPASRPRERDEALAELAARYVRGHGPAQAVDLAWWSGLTLRDARRALEAAAPSLRREELDRRTFWVDRDEAGPSEGPSKAAPPMEGPVVHLLPNYDELLIAFRDRTDATDPGLPEAARVAESILAHVLVRDGLVVGGWRRREGSRATSVALDALVELNPAERRAFRAQVERLAAFLGRPVEATGLD